MREQRHAFCYLPLRHLFRFCCCISDYHRRMKRELIYADRLSPTPASSAFCNIKTVVLTKRFTMRNKPPAFFFLLFIYFFFVFVNSLCAMLLSFFLSVNIFYPLCSLRFTAIIHLSVCVVQRVRVYCIQCTHNGKTLLKHNTEQWIIINYELFNSSVYSQRDHRMCLISSFSLFGSLALWLSMYN